MKKFVVFIFLALIAACSTHSPNDGQDHSAMDHSQMDHGSMDHSGMESSSGAVDAPADLQFIDTMIAHHQGAVDMAKLADGRAGREEMKKYAAAIIAAQEREITQMKRWRGEWFKDAAPAINMDFPGMREGMLPMDVKKLEALTGNDFDREFLRQMIFHHEGALTMADALLGKGDARFKGERAELRTLAEAIIKAQKVEIDQMKKWLGEWDAPAK